MTNAKWTTRFALLSLMTAMLAACGGDEETAGTDNDPSTALPPPSNVRPNQPPSIAGAPADRVVAGALYQFRPSALDPDGDALSYAISNRPPWAAFDRSSGRLQGIPGVSDAGTYSNIAITVSDGRASATLKSFSILVSNPNTVPPPAPTPANVAPTITGTPSTSVIAGNAYSFRPTANDANGDPLTFSITNRPPWATFDQTNGRLQGTPSPADVGNYASIRIRVSDGTVATSLPAFAVTVVAVANGSATLSWMPPTQNEDGSPLTNLAGYKVHWGTAAGDYTNDATINNAGITTYVVENLTPGTYYFALSAFTNTDLASDFSNEARKTIQ